VEDSAHDPNRLRKNSLSLVKNSAIEGGVEMGSFVEPLAMLIRDRKKAGLFLIRWKKS
jgi:hypothetical protein